VTTLVWLAASSLAWGAALWFAAMMLQRHNDLSGRARQWIWRGATLLLIAPWIAAPVVGMLGLGLAPSDTAMAPVLAAQGFPADLAVVSAVDAANVTTAVIERENGLPSWLKGLAFGEMLVLALMAGWIVRFVAAQLSTRALLGIVATSREAEAGLALGSLSVWSARLRLRRRPELRIVAPGVSPFSFGVLKPVICLPEGLEHKLGREALDLVVGHECLHVSRGDGWRRPLERVCADIFWFNPFAWAMRRELDMARELACDEGVVDLSAARHAYARTLRDVAGMTAGLPAALPAASMSLAGSGRSLVLRVKRTLAQARRKPARVALMAAAALGAAGACTSVGQAMLATPTAERGFEVVTRAPAEVTFAGKLDKEGWYIELKQIGGEIGEAKAKTCLVEAWRFDKLNVKTGQMLKAGAIVGTGRPVVSSDFVCRDMITGAGAEYALDPKREPGGMRFTTPASTPPSAAPAQTVPAANVLRISGKTSPILDQAARLTAPYGDWRDPFTGETALHAGVDLAASYGAPILAPVDGRVAFAGVKGGYGRVVELDAGDGITMRFGHLNAITVETGAQVKAGDKIGSMGSTGRSTGAHVHFEYLRDGKTYDPRLVENLTFATSLEIDPQVAPPTPPAPPSPPASVAPVAPLLPAPDPIAPPSGATPVAPVTPVAPRAPAAAQVSPQPELITVRAPFAARVLAIEPAAASGAVGVRLQQMASRAHPVPADGCVVFYSYIENPRVAVAQTIFEGWVIGFGKPGAAEMAASCDAPIPAMLPTPSLQPEVRITNAPSPVIDGPARFTSGYGFRTDPFTRESAWHEGIDIAKFAGATIRAPGAGVVTFAGVKAAYGNLVELDLGDGFRMRFGQLQEMKVKLGDKVKAGDVVGTMGSSGPSTGPHLHFEVYRNGMTVDPMLLQGLTPIGPG